jgi:hypothetical protein
MREGDKVVVKVEEQSGWRIAQNGGRLREIVIPVTVFNLHNTLTR